MKDIKEHQVFYHYGYMWKAIYRDSVLMLFSNSDGFNRWASITKDNMKGMSNNLNINRL